MKVYQYVGNGKSPGVSVPGVPSVVEKAVGDQWIKDYEAAKKADNAAAKKAKTAGEVYYPATFYGDRGFQLKTALANKVYVEAETKEETESVEKALEVKE